MASFWEAAQGVLSRGIDAYAETQQVRYEANSPVANQRATGDRSSLAGGPAFQTFADVLSNPINLVLLGVAGMLVFALLKRA